MILAAIEGLSPLAVLSRGYGIVTDAQGHVLRDALQIRERDAIAVRLARGSLAARVERVDLAEGASLVERADRGVSELGQGGDVGAGVGTGGSE